MAKTKADLVRQLGNLPGAGVLEDPRIQAFFLLAETKLKLWIGSTAYDLNANKKIVEQAESFLVLHYGTRVSWNNAVTKEGMMQTKNLGGDGGTITLISQDEAKKKSEEYLAMAYELATPVLLPTATPDGNIPLLGISYADYTTWP